MLWIYITYVDPWNVSQCQWPDWYAKSINSLYRSDACIYANISAIWFIAHVYTAIHSHKYYGNMIFMQQAWLSRILKIAALHSRRCMDWWSRFWLMWLWHNFLKYRQSLWSLEHDTEISYIFHLAVFKQHTTITSINMDRTLRVININLVITSNIRIHVCSIW